VWIWFSQRFLQERVSNRTRLVFWLLILFLLVFTTYRYCEKAYKPSRLGTQTRTAILRWKDQVQRLVEGQNVYPAGNPYPNPPIMALILSPLYELELIQTALVWFAIKVVLAAISLYWTFLLIRALHPPVPDWVLAVFIVLSLHPILGDLSHGNVNIFIAFLVIATLKAYHRGWDWLAGVVLGLVIACKITPLLFVPYFGWKWLLLIWDRWRAKLPLWNCLANPGLKVLLGTVLGLVLWFVVVPGAYLGWNHNFELLQSWYTGMVKPFVVDGKITSEHANQSLPGYFVRLLTNQPSSIDYDEDDRPVATDFHNVVEWDPIVVARMIRVCQVLFVLGLMRWCWLRLADQPEQRRGLQFAAECAYIILGMMLFSERTWKHHGVVLMVPYAVIALAIATIPRKVLRCIWISILGLVALLTIGPGMLAEKGQDEALAYGSHTWAYLLLLTGVVLVLRHFSRRSSDTAGPSD
jgi:alpha-1,2-mannosyltransferase